MDLHIASQIARTHLLAKKRQTLVAMLGVTFGIAMFITMISFMQGVNQFLEDSALDASPHIRMYNEVNTQRPGLIEALKPNGFNVIYHQKPKNESARLKNGLIMAQHIEREPGVLGVSPQIATQVFYNNGPIQLSGTISGVDIDRENRLYKLTTRLKSGSLKALKTNPDGLIMGSVLARKLNVQLGDKVTVTLPGGGTRILRVVGTFGFGVGTVDNTKSYANISTVQEIMQRDPSYITDIHIKMIDPLQAIDYGKRLRTMYGYYTEDWATANTAILAGEKIRNMLTYVVSITLLVVAGFGIYNIMNMTVINKIKDIAILKATGFDGKDIVAIFLLQALFIGFTGGLLGLVIGFGLSYLLSITPFDAGDFLSIKTFPVIFAPKYYGMGLLFGIVTTVLAGYFPSRKAAQVDPVSILRG
ncbi:ABC transporter permease [Spirosoma utsteinense]|uniref:Lipoprotein-releasing system permease protein n=1 Tax=Spirosoma utsteinense TaxID=2585773 RepID=A0ABR6VZG6_9BACT|nr:FtsX-like permease family protein [Spirosoma utsteinense]MBC3784528.1 lipoprotein-releasing system permease protein [Spirosoma utsteinense]MBC3789721.1 lipoprotein-releasing system permease protein [Spirosoma utsteinense]